MAVTHRDSVCVGPVWLQWHSCEFVMDIRRGARGSGHAKAKREKERLYFLCLAKARWGGIYTWQVCYMQGSDLDRKGNQGCTNEYNDAIYSKGEFSDAWSWMRCCTTCMACIDGYWGTQNWQSVQRLSHCCSWPILSSQHEHTLQQVKTFFEPKITSQTQIHLWPCFSSEK